MGFRYNPLQYAGLIPSTSGGGGSSTTNNVEYFTLDSTDIANKSVTLLNTPLESSDVMLDVAEGTMQIYGTDYTVSGTTLSWNGLGLEPLLESGMTLIINYVS
jgi:hypothetical protein